MSTNNTIKYGPEMIKPGEWVVSDEADRQAQLSMAENKDRDDQINLCLKLIDRASGLIAVAHSELKALLERSGE